jgi:hypothetical protein
MQSWVCTGTIPCDALIFAVGGQNPRSPSFLNPNDYKGASNESTEPNNAHCDCRPRLEITSGSANRAEARGGWGWGIGAGIAAALILSGIYRNHHRYYYGYPYRAYGYYRPAYRRYYCGGYPRYAYGYYRPRWNYRHHHRHRHYDYYRGYRRHW